MTLEFTSKARSTFSPEEAETLRKMAEIMKAIETKGYWEETAPGVTDEELKDDQITFGKSFRGKKEKGTEVEGCQQIVREDELSEYLSKGWWVAVILPSGKIEIDNGY